MKERSKLAAQHEISEVERLTVLWAEAAKLPIISPWKQMVQVLLLGWRSICRSPLTSILTLLSTTASMFLVALFLLVVTNTRQTVASMSQKVAVSIYIKDGVEGEAVTKLVDEVKRSPGVVSAEHRTKEQALKAFQGMVGADSPMLSGLQEKNPLPASIEVSFSDDAVRQELFRRVINDFSISPHVESVRINEGAFSQLGVILKALRMAGWLGTLLMLAISGLIISNAVRLGTYAHRQEIEIMELVGATKWYMRAPFLVEGALEGFLGASFGILFLLLVFAPLRSFIAQSEVTLVWVDELKFLSIDSILFILLAGLLTGLLTSILATQSVES